MLTLQSDFRGYNIIWCFGANNLKLQGAVCACEAQTHYRRFTITCMHIIFLASSGGISLHSRYIPFPAYIQRAWINEWASRWNVFRTNAQKWSHSDLWILCQRIRIFRIISPKYIQLSVITRRQESLKHCNNYGATSTCFVVNKEKKIL